MKTFILNTLRAIRAVLWSFIGLRQNGLQKDAKIHPVHIIVVAVLLAAFFVWGLLKIVRQVLA